MKHVAKLKNRRSSAIIIVVVLFAALGVAFLWKSFAASTVRVLSNDSSFSLNKGSYGSLDGLRSKGYTHVNLFDVADKATTPVTNCSLGTADKRLDWQHVSCQPFEDKGWRQQGITGVGGSTWSNRDNIIVTSWHDGDGVRARLTVMNTDTNKRSFVELVRPCDESKGYCSMASSSSQCSSVHAGGTVWYRNLLYVADTNCVMVYNIEEAYKVSDGSYILPATGYWKRQNTSYGISGIGLDTSGTVPQLLTVNYESGGCNNTDFGLWNLDSRSGEIIQNYSAAKSPSLVSSSQGMFHINDVCNAQGITRVNKTYFISTSGGGTDYMYRFRTSSTQPDDTKFLMPYNTPQNLYVDPKSGLTWGLTESPNGSNDKSTRIFSWSTAKMLQ